MLMAAVAFTLLTSVLVAAQGPGSRLAEALGADVKGKVSLVLYLCAIPLAFVNQWISDALYVSVTLIWLVPDTRIESKIGH